MSPDDVETARYTPSISDPHLHALGAVAFWSGRIERVLIELLGALVSDHPGTGQTVADGMQFQEAVRLVSAVLEVQDHAALREAFRALRPDLLAAMKTRNDLLHGDWDTSFGDASTPTVLSIRRSGRSEQVITHDRLVRSARELANVANVLTDLLNGFIFESEGDVWYSH